MNKNHFRTPGGQHESLSKSPYSQHQLHHPQGSLFFFFTRVAICTGTPWCAACCLLSLIRHICFPSAAVSQILGPDPSLRPSLPLSLPPPSWAFPRRCRVGSLHVTGAAALLLSPPRSPCAAAAAHPAYKGRGANFLWHMLLQSALLHLLSGFVVFKIAEAPLLSQHSLSLSIQPAHTLVFCLCKHSWLLWMQPGVVRSGTSWHPLPFSLSHHKLVLPAQRTDLSQPPAWLSGHPIPSPGHHQGLAPSPLQCWGPCSALQTCVMIYDLRPFPSLPSIPLSFPFAVLQSLQG